LRKELRRKLLKKSGVFYEIVVCKWLIINY